MSDQTLSRTPAMLRAAAGDYLDAAAVELFLALPYIRDREDIADRYIVELDDGYSQPVYVVRWATLYDDILTGQVPVSPGERRMLLIACSIAVPNLPVSLHETLTGLDHGNAAQLLAAVDRIVRRQR